ncbi:UdgX family uracil-DNA binding protein [Candidatus Korobacter versatilis]|nr:UdgX family uracil-DNA binding protein [Candidatus Koribacter versatilis]
MRRKPVQSELPLLMKPRSLEALAHDAKDCRNCDLWKTGTQTVFGEGGAHARVVFVGEQPGDKEDLEGRPFVGPAGNLLNTALEQAGINRNEVYVTNAVKHFKWEPRGKRRLHKKPNAAEVAACRSWMDGEIAAIQPEIIVCLGATAAQAMLGRSFRVTKQRGEFLPGPNGASVLATVHPSSILRAPDEDARHEEMRLFVDDLRKVAARMNVKRAA